MLLIKRSLAIPIRIGFYYVHEKKLAMVSPKGNPKTSGAKPHQQYRFRLGSSKYIMFPNMMQIIISRPYQVHP
jgi:hypothetical protein